MPIFPYKPEFLHFVLAVWSCFLVLESEMTPPSAIQMDHFYDADNFLGHS